MKELSKFERLKLETIIVDRMALLKNDNKITTVIELLDSVVKIAIEETLNFANQGNK